MTMLNAMRTHPRLALSGWVLLLMGAALSMRAGSGIMRNVEPHRVEPRPEPAVPRVQSFADRQIATAHAAIEQAPSAAAGYTALAAAYLHKARETGDFGFNTQADAALARALATAPDNFDAVKLQAMLLLAAHRFGEALEVARRAVQQRPQDHEAYGPLVDALVELGRYGEARSAAQQMVDLRPDTAAYARVSYLRALHGDSAGAIGAMQLAVQAANPADPESIAWCRVHLGDELMNAGRRAEAEREFDLALATFPDYHLALAAKARARFAAGDADAARAFLLRAQNRVPLPDTVIALGDLYAQAGRPDDAQRQYALLEFIEHAGAPGAATYSRQLALFYADHDLRLDEALAIARRERAARADVYASDLLAWCLFKTGALAEAKKSMAEALRLGTHDARLYYHAGMIHKGLGDRAAAMTNLRRALEINPSFDVQQAAVARRVLHELEEGR
jgi:tetratricopeptide (TPR) repeat protein